MLCAAAQGWAQAPQPGFADALLGRWDLTIEAPDGPYPSWLEVQLRTETQLMGRFVGRVGSVRYVSDIDYAAGRVTLRVPVQYERDIDALRFEGTVRGDRIEGTTLAADGAAVRFTAARAPALVAGVEAEVARSAAAHRTAAISRAGRRAARIAQAAGACRAAC